MTMNKLSIENPFKIVNTVSDILGFNKQYQQGKRLKILTPEQMLSRLPIFFSSAKSRK